MKILGLDISSVSTGYCIISNGKLLKNKCGIITTNQKKNHSERLREFALGLEKILDDYKPDEIICEDVFRGRNIITFKVLCMFRGVALDTIYRKTGITPISVMPSEARKIVGIKNDKEEVFNFIVKKYKLLDYNFKEHNDLTDAITIGLCGHLIQKNGINLKDLKKKRRKKRRKKAKKK